MSIVLALVLAAATADVRAKDIYADGTGDGTTGTPGAGTAFHILFPAVADGQVVLDAAETGIPPQRGTETVLVAEDDPAVRELMCTLLATNGYSVLLASNGEEALGIASSTEQPIQLLVTDVVMPSLGGRALVERVRASRPAIRGRRLDA